MTRILYGVPDLTNGSTLTRTQIKSITPAGYVAAAYSVAGTGTADNTHAHDTDLALMIAATGFSVIRVPFATSTARKVAASFYLWQASASDVVVAQFLGSDGSTRCGSIAINSVARISLIGTVPGGAEATSPVAQTVAMSQLNRWEILIDRDADSASVNVYNTDATTPYASVSLPSAGFTTDPAFLQIGSANGAAFTGWFSRLRVEDGATVEIGPYVPPLIASVSDTASLTDAISGVVSSVRSVADTASVVDAPSDQILAVSLPIDDTAGISDAVTRMASAARSIADAAGISDSTASSLSVVSAIVDQAGLTDSSAVATSAARGPAEAAGIGDQTAATLAVTRTPADQLGATDSVTVSITSAGDALVTDTVGAVDQVTVSATSSRTIADAVTLTDGATAILTAGAIPVEMIGLGDAVTAELTTTRDVSEAIGVVDQVAAFLLSRGEAADPAGIGDQVAAEIQRARQADDVTEVSDTLATLAVSVRTLTDTGTLTDVVTAVLAPSVAPLGRTLLVYYERRYRHGWTGTIDHDPQAKLDYTWDWTDWLGGDTIISATVTAKVEEARDPADVVTIDDVWPSPKTITAWISGGVHGTPCAVTCRITTTAGRIDDRTIRLRVRDR